jgi:hypothetical protein
MRRDGWDRLLQMLAARTERCQHVWDSLWQRKSIGRIAVAVSPSPERVKQCEELFRDFPLPPAPTAWHDLLRHALAELYARTQLPGDYFPALGVPRSVHGQSQGACDVFGCELIDQAEGLVFCCPLSPDAVAQSGVQVGPLERSRYWGAVEWLRFARQATEGRIEFRNPVMTGALDTANYLLGTTALMEWITDRPRELHSLLGAITETEIRWLSELKQAAGGTLHAEAFACTRGGFSLCSECRSLISAEAFEQFEAPYLRRVGERAGSYGIHSCGTWERTIPSALHDPNLRVMNGQVRENDLRLLCQGAAGKITLSIGRSVNLSERYTWRSTEDYFSYVLETAPRTQPLEMTIGEQDIPLWNDLCRKAGVEHNLVEDAGVLNGAVARA